MSRTILVTGASKGIGRAIATHLARDGFYIVVHYGGDKDGAEQTLGEIIQCGGQGRLISFDISNRIQCETVLQNDMDANGLYYGVVLNAGIARDTAFPAMDATEWDSVLSTNLDGFYNVLKPVSLPMISARCGGRIVTLSSVSGITGNRGQVNYSAAKAGIIGATKALAVELAKRQITVNCVAPGIIDTQMTAVMHEDALKEAIGSVPMRRMGRPEEVASVVSFLCSDDASYITRQVISVNGGMV